MKRFEEKLPDGYKADMVIDATEKKTVIYMNVAALIMTALSILIAYLITKPDFRSVLDVSFGAFFTRYFIFIVAMFAYVVLHELVHGAAYKLLTGRKLTFGIKISCAYCGVPDIFVYRTTAMISLMAPFVVFDIVFILAAILFSSPIDKFLALVLFGIHFGGCVGDLYDTLVYLFKYKNPDTLMNDTGPKQTFYVK